jgi:hypothetical protein
MLLYSVIQLRAVHMWTDVSKEHISYIFRARTLLQDGFWSGWFSALKIEVIHSSETSVHIRTTRRCKPEDGNIHKYRFENLVSYIIQSCWDAHTILHNSIRLRPLNSAFSSSVLLLGNHNRIYSAKSICIRQSCFPWESLNAWNKHHGERWLQIIEHESKSNSCWVIHCELDSSGCASLSLSDVGGCVTITTLILIIGLCILLRVYQSI